MDGKKNTIYYTYNASDLRVSKTDSEDRKGSMSCNYYLEGNQLTKTEIINGTEKGTTSMRTESQPL